MMASWLPVQSSRLRISPCPQQVVVASYFRLNVTCHPFNWIPAGRAQLLKAARFNNLRQIILNASTTDPDLSDDTTSGTQMKDTVPRQLHADAILVGLESTCIAIASVSCLASLALRGSQDSRLVTSSVLEPIMPRKADLPLWQTTFLLAALIINSILRGRQQPSRDGSTNLTRKVIIQNPTLEGRVEKLEEEVASAVTILRVLSKQLEKLAVRFRVTRQTLRDPIQETAALAQKTSEHVTILAAREDDLKKNMEEMHYILIRMQENQTKQLELISTLGKLVKDRPVKKVEKNNKTTLRKSLGTGLQYIGKENVGKDSNSTLQNRLTKREGGPKISSEVQDEIPDTGQARMQSSELSNNVPSPLKPSCRAGDTQKVDFWRVPSNSTQEEDPINENVKRHSSSDGRPRTAFFD